jgi:histidinol-phosphate aminotransferase
LREDVVCQEDVVGQEVVTDGYQRTGNARHPFPRIEAASATSAYHGALDYAELETLGLDPEAVLDFSVNSNPYGPPPGVGAAVESTPLDRYPDREAVALRRALSHHLGVATDQIVVGNGTSELLWLVAAAFLRPRDPVVVVEPTFGEYARVSALMGAVVETWTARADLGFSVCEGAIASLLQRSRPRLMFVCNPNNPTGAVLPPEAVARWADAHPEMLLVVDEAYHSFAPGFRSALAVGADNVLVVRSMTKDYALAGLRLGYAVGCQHVIDVLTRVRPAWNVNALALAAGVAALSAASQTHLQQSLAALRRAKDALVDGLLALGLSPLPSATNFFLVAVGDGAAFRHSLLGEGILVRDCASFGLPAHIRIATRLPEENDRLLAAVRSLLQKGHVLAPEGTDDC